MKLLLVAAVTIPAVQLGHPVEESRRKWIADWPIDSAKARTIP
jgi:hypothetical protein